MVILSNIAAMNSANALNDANQSESLSLQRLSTGLRINNASDDAAGFAIAQNLTTQVSGTSQGLENAQDGISALTIAEGAANQVTDILQRMRELAVESANDTMSSSDRQYTNQEYQQLISEINRIADVTNFNGMKLISSTGTSSMDRFGIGGMNGSEGSALWVDANSVYGVDSITITIDTMTTNFLGVGAASAPTNLGVSTLTSQTDSIAAMNSLDASINSVNMMQANLGAYINRLEDTINNLQTENTNQTAAQSQIQDVDFASQTTEYTKDQILIQSATAMLAQANTAPQSVLTLISK
jgi:flagellin